MAWVALAMFICRALIVHTLEGLRPSDQNGMGGACTFDDIARFRIIPQCGILAP